jgi:hypothetical protein
VGGTDFDQLVATGTVKLDGILSITLANPLNLVIGDSFQIITAAKGLSGSFNQIVAPSPGAGRSWSVQYTANAALLKVVEAPPYLTIWRQSFGVNADGDLDGDGDTDGADFLLWQRTSPGGAHAVPEPAAVCMALLSLAFVPAVRRMLSTTR